MSADKAKLEITLEGDKAIREAKKVQSELKSTGSAGIKAGADVDAGAKKGASGLKQMGASAGSSGADLSTLSLTAIGLGQSITGVTDAIFGFQEKVVALQRSTFGLKQLAIETTRREEDLALAIQENTLSARDQKRAIEDLGLAYEALQIETDTVRAEQEALNGEYITFGINTAGVVMQSIIAITALTATDTGAKFANAVASSTMGTAVIGAATATKALTLAMLTSPMAPYAIAAIAAGAAFIAYNDDILGLRTGIEELTGQEKGSLPHLGFSITGVTEATGESTAALRDYQAEAERYAATANNKTVPALKNIETQTSKTTQAVRGLTQASSEFRSQSGFRLATFASGSTQVAIDFATARTLAAASLHEALKSGGFSGDQSLSSFSASASAISSGLASAVQAGGFTFGKETGNNSFNASVSTGRQSSTSASNRSISGSSKARSGGHGGANRADQYQAQKAYQKAIGSEAAKLGLEAMTGVSLNLVSTQKSGRGWSGRRTYDWDGLNARIAEANSRVSLFNQIEAINPFRLSDARQSSSALTSILANQNAIVTSRADTLNISRTSVIAFQSTQQGLVDLNGMLDFKERFAMISTGAA